MVSSLSSPISASKKLRGPSYSTMALTSQESEIPAQSTPTRGFSSMWPAWSSSRPPLTAQSTVSRSWPTTARSHGSSARKVSALGHPSPSPRGARPHQLLQGVILPRWWLRAAQGLCSPSAEQARHSREVTETLSPGGKSRVSYPELCSQPWLSLASPPGLGRRPARQRPPSPPRWMRSVCPPKGQAAH